ncbi:hypothetical protein D3C85_1115350 [compost metagenome]
MQLIILDVGAALIEGLSRFDQSRTDIPLSSRLAEQRPVHPVVHCVYVDLSQHLRIQPVLSKVLAFKRSSQAALNHVCVQVHALLSRVYKTSSTSRELGDAGDPFGYATQEPWILAVFRLKFDRTFAEFDVATFGCVIDMLAIQVETQQGFLRQHGSQLGDTLDGVGLGLGGLFRWLR